MIAGDTTRNVTGRFPCQAGTNLMRAMTDAPPPRSSTQDGKYSSIDRICEHHVHTAAGWDVDRRPWREDRKIRQTANASPKPMNHA